jgi:predicted transcriptional regulator
VCYPPASSTLCVHPGLIARSWQKDVETELRSQRIEMSRHNATEVSSCLAPAQPCNHFELVGRRSRLDIIFDVLDEVGADGEAGPTRLMYRTNTNWKVIKETMTYLNERALLTTQTVGAREVVSLSPIGFKLLENLRVVRSLLMPNADGSHSSLGTDEGEHHLASGRDEMLLPSASGEVV